MAKGKFGSLKTWKHTISGALRAFRFNPKLSRQLVPTLKKSSGSCIHCMVLREDVKERGTLYIDSKSDPGTVVEKCRGINSQTLAK
jgi:hypothetical protein